MNIRVTGMVILTLAAGLSACGKSNGNADIGKAGSSGSAGAAGAAGGGPVYCAKEICKAVNGMAAAPCCMDRFAGGCGVQSGNSCVKPPTPDARCPVPAFAAMMGSFPGASGGAPTLVTGCCTTDNQCGVDMGTGMGCQSRTAVCMFIPKMFVSMIEPLSCDGQTLPLPDNCGSDFQGFPGGAGTGATEVDAGE